MVDYLLFSTLSGKPPYKLTIMPPKPSRSARIEARITPNALKLVQRAAELSGRSLSDFVAAAARNPRIKSSKTPRLSALRPRTRHCSSICCSMPPPSPPPCYGMPRCALPKPASVFLH